MDIDIHTIEAGLTSKEGSVRRKWAESLDFTPTPEQIERGLSDKNSFVVQAWIMRTD